MLGDFIALEDEKIMKKIVIIIIILAILLVYSPYILEFFERTYIHAFKLGWSRGENTKEEIVKKYIDGLKTKNTQEIEKIGPKTYKSTEIIKNKIEKFNGADFTNIKIYYGTNPPQPFMVEIKNIKLKNGEVVSDNIWIEEDCFQYPATLNCKKWYLIKL